MCYSIIMVATIIGIFISIAIHFTYTSGLLKLGCFGSATTRLPECFCRWDLSLNIGLNMLPSESIMSCLDYLLVYFTGEFQALKLIVLVVFDAVH